MSKAHAQTEGGSVKETLRKRWGLTFALALFVFSVIVASALLTGIVIWVLNSVGVLDFSQYSSEFASESAVSEQRAASPFNGLAALLVICALLGFALSLFFGKLVLKPLRVVISATRKVAEGDFTVRFEHKGVYELEELSKSFNSMTTELASIETLRGDFINSFSHEFKTPIVSIRGFAILLKDDDLGRQERSEYLDIIIAESERLARLSTNVLSLAKYETTQIVTEKNPFRLDEQIRRVIVVMQPKWEGIIEMNAELDKITFKGNEELTAQIWLNLLDNAIKFSHRDGAIIIRLSQVDKDVLFTIQDNGVGFDASTGEKIFEKFYQGDSSHGREGNGLGLSIAKRITELCGGSIEAQSSPGRGSIFTVRLPNE